MVAERVYERIPADRPADANFGRIRARTPSQVAEMRRLRRAGVAVPEIAEMYGIHQRTVYRYTSVDAIDVVVEVCGWRATFELVGSNPPFRVSAWSRR